MSQNKILIVDDDELVLAGFRKVLELEGYTVKTATDGKDAIEMIKNETFDIVYTDLKMRTINGREVCKAVREISPKTEVVIFSGSPHALVAEHMEIIKEGAKDYYLRKPLSSKEILDVTRKILNSRQP